MVALISISFMINLAIYQSLAGLNIRGLEKCDIDFSIIKSK
jgi:hypothetical protein